MRHIHEFLRITAWFLLVVSLFAILSGFFTTKYFLFPWSYEISHYIHTIIVPLLFIPLFYLHSFCGILVLMHRKEFLRKKYLKIIVGIIWTSIIISFALFYIVEEPTKDIIPSSFSQSDFQKITTNLNASKSFHNSILLTVLEINKHNVPQDCWIIINNKIYDVTDYLKYHPGKPETITPYCGKNATGAFQTKDKGKPKQHSPDAYDLLNQFYIGYIGEGTTKQEMQEN